MLAPLEILHGENWGSQGQPGLHLLLQDSQAAPAHHKGCDSREATDLCEPKPPLVDDGDDQTRLSEDYELDGKYMGPTRGSRTSSF